MRSRAPSSRSSGADARPGNTGREGHEHAPGFLDRGARYDRYSESLLPAWLKLVLAGIVLGVLGLLAWSARSQLPAGDWLRAVAIVLPVAATVVLALALAEHRDPD